MLPAGVFPAAPALSAWTVTSKVVLAAPPVQVTVVGTV
jgi:hypothetical protein